MPNAQLMLLWKNLKMNNFLTRRKFFCALVASVITVGAPLPIGFPKSRLELGEWTAYDAFSAHLEEINLDKITYRLQLRTVYYA